MPSSQTRLIVASALALVLTLGAPQSSIAQRTKGDEGTGGAAGYSPPVDQPGAADAPAAPSTTAPAKPEDTGEPPPMPDSATPSDKKDDGAPPSDAPTGADIPD
jgi:hypothetical protein